MYGGTPVFPELPMHDWLAWIVHSVHAVRVSLTGMVAALGGSYAPAQSRLWVRPVPDIVRNVGLELRNVRLELRNVSLDLRNVSSRLPNVSFQCALHPIP